MVFYSLFGKVPLFEILHNKPNMKQYRLFLRLLTEVINHSSNISLQNKPTHLSQELQFHRWAKSKRLIDNKSYAQARATILKSYNS